MMSQIAEESEKYLDYMFYQRRKRYRQKIFEIYLIRYVIRP